MYVLACLEFQIIDGPTIGTPEENVGMGQSRLKKHAKNEDVEKEKDITTLQEIESVGILKKCG